MSVECETANLRACVDRILDEEPIHMPLYVDSFEHATNPLIEFADLEINAQALQFTEATYMQAQ